MSGSVVLVIHKIYLSAYTRFYLACMVLYIQAKKEQNVHMRTPPLSVTRFGDGNAMDFTIYSCIYQQNTTLSFEVKIQACIKHFSML